MKRLKIGDRVRIIGVGSNLVHERSGKIIASFDKKNGNQGKITYIKRRPSNGQIDWYVVIPDLPNFGELLLSRREMEFIE